VKRLLIVDDSPAIRRSLRILLQYRSDWEICGEAENGREGIDKALLLSPDLIVIDLAMPVMNGFQAAQELQRLLPKIPLLMYTSFAGPEIEHQALAAGISAIRSKSDGIESLCGSIEELLQRSAEC
jgi:DNA-binding NarL/FixJ family response regulator